ncbi:ABC transporter substrate-binding protein [Klebsiella quasipneumoniae]|nr:ABC transporter substrate-binding protein [Klebsiella quasipneumoniae]MDK1366540.1 ABC transporter substrate-binding protein [Klebsiella quasipneumoniae]
MHRHFRLPALAALFLSGAFSVWAADTPVKGGTLIYLEQQPHTNLYPPAGGFYPNGGILNQITDKLTWQNPKTLEIEPWIAESWTSNADKTEYTFHLRKGVTFSDGTPLDAAAVAKNFDTYGLGDKAHRLPVSEVINNYQRSEVIDPLTVKFYFNKPSPGFLQGTATIGSGLVSLSTLQRNFEELGDARHIIGSGPFVVQDEKPGRELTLVARKDYQWGPKNIAQQGPANLDGITYIVTPEDSVRIGALPTAALGILPTVIGQFHKQQKDITLQVATMNNTMLLAGLKSGEIDIGIGRMSDPELMSGLHYELLFLESLKLVVRPGHPLLQETVTLSRVMEWPVVVSPKGTVPRQNAEALLQSQGCKMPAGCIETLSASLSRQLTVDFDYVWFVPSGAVKDDLRRGVLTALPIATQGAGEPIGILTRVDATLTPGTQTLLSAIRKSMPA